MRPAPFSILIITYNRCADLLALLQNIARFHHEHLLHELIIVNNASTESYQSIEDFIQQQPQLNIRYHFSTENLGVARGRNKAVELSSSPWLIFLDDDVEINDVDFLLHSLQMVEDTWPATDNVGLFTYRIFYYDTNDFQINAFPHKQFEKRKQLNKFLTYYFVGAAHIIKKEVFTQCGLYPPDFFYGMEEYDLSYRAVGAGFKAAYDNRVTVLHKESPLGRQPHATKMQMAWHNKCKVAWRYLPKKYFYTTAIMWSLQYLAQTRLDIKGWWTTWKKISRIPSTEKRTPLPPQALAYLKEVEARLSY